MSRTMKIRKLKLFYFQKNARYRAKELCRNIFLGNLSFNEGKISVDLPVLILEFWWRHVKTKNWVSNVIRRRFHCSSTLCDWLKEFVAQTSQLMIDIVIPKRILTLVFSFRCCKSEFMLQDRFSVKYVNNIQQNRRDSVSFSQNVKKATKWTGSNVAPDCNVLLRQFHIIWYSLEK